MFSIEKNYLREQNFIINKLKKDLKESHEEIERLSQSSHIANSSLAGDKVPLTNPDAGEFSGIDEIYPQDSTESDIGDISEEQLDELLADNDIKHLDPELQKELENNHLPPVASFSLDDIDIEETYEMYIPKYLLAHLKELNPQHYYRGKRKFVTLVPVKFLEINQLYKQLSPEAYIKFSNKLFNQLFASIYKHGGMVSGYSGENLMAVFGLFDVDHPSQARKALACVEELQHKLQTINDYLNDKDLHSVNACVGVHCGEVIVGKVGPVKGGDLLIMGDIVRVADAVCESSRALNYQTVISDKTKDILGDSFSVKEEHAIDVPGSNGQMRVYSL
ncbi:MAG: adenylate/guanylate cyclase domain-containing protein [Spirochaetota bacterium]|nr:adenylate/guanylate cyclase domain-containing protein [Spirochaetota bacterium]